MEDSSRKLGLFSASVTLRTAFGLFVWMLFWLAVAFMWISPLPSYLPLYRATPSVLGSAGDNTSHTTKSTTERRRVTVLGYWRSGSTLTGQLFNFNPEALYFFEPLAAVTSRWGWEHGVTHPRNFYYHDNGTEIMLSSERAALLTNTLAALLSCNFSAVDQRVFTHGFMSSAGWTRDLTFGTRPFRNCMRNSRARKRGLENCLSVLAEKCRRSSLVAAKVIRLRMRHAERLLSEDPDHRLIHLVRDPRGLLGSWQKRRRHTPDELRSNARLICLRMMSECLIRKRLERKFPGRILLLRYEDLVARPEKILTEVYENLLQRRIPVEVEKALKAQLHAASYNGPMGTKRVNATQTASEWRQKLDPLLANYTTNVCRPLLTELGLKE